MVKFVKTHFLSKTNLSNELFETVPRNPSHHRISIQSQRTRRTTATLFLTIIGPPKGPLGAQNPCPPTGLLREDKIKRPQPVNSGNTDFTVFVDFHCFLLRFLHFLHCLEILLWAIWEAFSVQVHCAQADLESF